MDRRGQRIDQADHFVRLEAAAFRHDLHAQPRDVLHDVDAGAVAHRRGVQDGVTRHHRIDLAAIGEARHRQIVMREHGALRPPGRAGSIEQPGEIIARARHDRDRIGAEQRLVFGAADRDQALERLRRVRRDLAVDAGRSEADARAGLLQDIAELGAMQLGVGGNGGEAGVPNAVQQREIVGRILGRDGDAVAGRKFEPAAQRAGQARGARGELAIGRNDAGARSRRRQRRMTESGAIKP